MEVWDLERRIELRTLRGHEDFIYRLVVTPDGRRAVSVSFDKTLRIWNLETGQELRSLKAQDFHIADAVLTPDGRRLIYTSGSLLKVSELDSGLELQSLEGHTDRISHVVVTPDGSRAISRSGDKTLKGWDLASGSELRTIEGPESIDIMRLTSDGLRLVVAKDSTLKVWDWATGAAIAEFACDSDVEYCECGLLNLIFARDARGSLYILSLEE
jgi:WD40 repeat protein